MSIKPFTYADQSVINKGGNQPQVDVTPSSSGRIKMFNYEDNNVPTKDTVAKPTSQEIVKIEPISNITPPKVEDGGVFSNFPNSQSRLRDVANSFTQGVYGVPEAITGILDIFTKGYAGKFVEQAEKSVLGSTTKEMRDYLQTFKSSEQKKAEQKVQETKGFTPTIKTMLENPSTIAGGIAESLPSMFAGGLVGKSLGFLASASKYGLKISPTILGSIGEGSISAGQTAEQTRQQQENGLLTGTQAGVSGISGILTGTFGTLGGKLASKLGVADVDTLLAGGTSEKVKKSILTTAFKGALSESVFEELPQSMQEQIASNINNNRPWDEGVAEAGAQGAITAIAMGGAVSGGSQARTNMDFNKIKETIIADNKDNPVIKEYVKNEKTFNDVMDYIQSTKEVETPEQVLAKLKESGLDDATAVQMMNESVLQDIRDSVANPVTPEDIQSEIDSFMGTTPVVTETKTKESQDHIADADNMFDEARKYKSAEEFVKAQGNPVYHGTGETFDKFELQNSKNLGPNAIFFSPERDSAKYYARGEKPTVKEAYVDKSNLFDYESPKDMSKLWDTLNKKNKDEIMGFETTDYVTIDKIKNDISRGDYSIIEKDVVQEAIRKAGFEGFYIKDYTGPKVMAIFNPEKIKTKSQLTEIWNKSQEKSPKVAETKQVSSKKSRKEAKKVESKSKHEVTKDTVKREAQVKSVSKSIEKGKTATEIVDELQDNLGVSEEYAQSLVESAVTSNGKDIKNFDLPWRAESSPSKQVEKQASKQVTGNRLSGSKADQNIQDPSVSVEERTAEVKEEETPLSDKRKQAEEKLAKIEDKMNVEDPMSKAFHLGKGGFAKGNNVSKARAENERNITKTVKQAKEHVAVVKELEDIAIVEKNYKKLTDQYQEALTLQKNKETSKGVKLSEGELRELKKMIREYEVRMGRLERSHGFVRPEIAKNTNVPTIEEEAKEYDTLNSFLQVKLKFTHETNVKDFYSFDMSKIGSGQGDSWLGRGIYLQENGSWKIEKYGDNKVEAGLTPDANIFKIKNTPDSKYRDNFVEYAVNNSIGFAKGLAEDRVQEGLSLDNLLPRDILRTNPEAVTHLKEAGYDGLLQDGELVIYNDKIIKTKAELTDIWNKVHGKVARDIDVATKDDYTKGMSNLQKSNVDRVLGTKIRLDGKVMTKKESIEKFVSEGYIPKTFETNKIKDPSRTQFNRMNQQEQDAFERKQKEAGKKIEYTLYNDGKSFDVTKIEYDYATSLVNKEVAKDTNVPTKVQDKVVYRGTENGGELKESFLTDFGDGYYFADKKDTAKEYGKVVDTYTVNLDNPLVIKDRYEMNTIVDNFLSLKAQGKISYTRTNEYLKSQGYDGIIVKNGGMGSEDVGGFTIVFDKKSIKTNTEVKQVNETDPIKRNTAIVIKLQEGTATLEEYNAGYKDFIESKEAIKAQLLTQKKDELMKRIGRFSYSIRPSSSKNDMVSTIIDTMEERFALSRNVVYSFGGTGYAGAIKLLVEKTTQEDLTKYAEKVKENTKAYAESIQAHKKALTNPETLDEFKTYLQANNGDTTKLTPEQLKNYDELLALAGKAKREKDIENKGYVRGVNAGTDLTVTESKNTKTGEDIFVVKLSDRVEKETYQALNTSAKKLGGYYSRFSKGFLFKDRASAEQFVQVGNGKEVKTDAPVIRAENKKNATAQKLADMALSMREKANEELNRERQTNTSRRAGMASSAEESARVDLAMADTMENLAKAIESREAVLLDGITARTQIEALDSVLRRAHYENSRKIEGYGKQEEFRKQAPTEEDVPFVSKFPDPVGMVALKEAVQKGLKTSGSIKLAKTIQKAIQKLPADTNVFPASFKGMETIVELADSLNLDSYSSLRHEVATFKRLKAMGVTGTAELRAILREYLTYRGTKQEANKAVELERKLIGAKVGIDFFPTPKALAERMVSDAGVEAGMKVLEPSAGNGNIAEVMKDKGANVDVIEISSELRTILTEKGFNVVDNDFMDYKEGGYDAIVMNPPFSSNQDMKHIKHAYTLLKDGGKLSAIAGEGAFLRNNATSQEFKDWLDEVGADVEQLPANTFTDKKLMVNTGANARLITIEKSKTEDKTTISVARQMALDEVKYYLEASQAGKRVFIPQKDSSDYEIRGIKSTFPQFIPENMRSRKMFDNLIPYWENQERPPKKGLLQSLYNMFQKHVNDQEIKYQESETKRNLTEMTGQPEFQRIEDTPEIYKRKGELFAQAQVVAIDLENKAITQEEADKISTRILTEFNELDKASFQRTNNSKESMVNFADGKKRVESYKKRLKLDFDVDFVHVIVTPEGERAYGVTYNNKISLTDNIKLTTADHELVHIVVDHIEEIDAFKGITKAQLLKAQNRGKDYTAADYERLNEGLAKGFQKKILGESQSNVPMVIRQFYDKLLILLTDMFRALGADINVIQDFYRKLAVAEGITPVTFTSSEIENRRAQFERNGKKYMDFSFEAMKHMDDIIPARSFERHGAENMEWVKENMPEYYALINNNPVEEPVKAPVVAKMTPTQEEKIGTTKLPKPEQGTESVFKNALDFLGLEEEEGKGKYDKVTFKDQIAKAITILQNNEELATDIALRKKKAPEGVLDTSISVAVQAKALQDKNWELFKDVAEARSEVQTERGQGIVLEKLRNMELGDFGKIYGDLQELQSKLAKAKFYKNWLHNFNQENQEPIKKTIRKATAKEKVSLEKKLDNIIKQTSKDLDKYLQALAC